jgi:hypothetical protein
MRATWARESFGIIMLGICGLTGMHAAVPPGTRQALAEFETGATRASVCAGDFAVGSRQEISRFQILPAVWRQYSSARNHQNPEAAWAVTSRILRDREAMFRRATGREWEAIDLYLMWNAPGLYERAGWERSKVSRVVLERAQRFANVLESRTRPSSAQSLVRN